MPAWRPYQTGHAFEGDHGTPSEVIHRMSIMMRMLLAPELALELALELGLVCDRTLSGDSTICIIVCSTSVSKPEYD